MNRSYFFIALALLLLTLSFSLLGFHFFAGEQQTFYTSVNVTIGNAGFDLNSSALVFGNVPIGGSGNRNFIFQNGNGQRVVLFIDATGDIAPLLSFEKRVVVDAGATEEIGFSVSVPTGHTAGLYEGTVVFRIQPALF